MSGYYAMLNTTRWQRSRGRDFVFYDPHPGFVDGNVEANYHEFICDTLQFAMHIVVERTQRMVCQVSRHLSQLPVASWKRSPVCCMAGRNATHS